MTPNRRGLAGAVVALAALTVAACAGDPQTTEERRRVGDGWVGRMTAHLDGGPAVSVSIRGTRQRLRGGQATTVPFTLDLLARRAGGVHARQVADGAVSEAWYNGTTLTLASDEGRSVEAVPSEGGQDAALARIAERFGLDPTLAGIVSAGPRAGGFAAGGAGGWAGRESVGGVLCEHLAYQGQDLEVELWIASSGDPLPQRLLVTRRDPAGQTTSDVSFSRWNLAPDVADQTFEAVLPGESDSEPPTAPPGS